jgi:predicted Zn-dependent protease
MMSGAPRPSGAAIEQVAARLAADPDGARRQAETLLRAAPNDPRLLLILASARRRLGEAKAAKAILAPLAKAYPRAATTAYELGLTLADLGESDAAISALRQAVALNRDLADAWRALGEQLFQLGDGPGAEAAFAQHTRAAVTDPALKPAAEALCAGDLAAAETGLRALLTARPDTPAALRMLADVYMRKSDVVNAEILLARAVELEPGHLGGRFSLAEALFMQQKAAAALALVEPLLAAAPADPAYRNLCAACLGLIGEDARMLELRKGLAEAFPGQPRLWLNYGHALRAIGRREEAIAAYRRSIALAPTLGDAYWSLANLKVPAVAEDQIGTMRGLLASSALSADDALHLNYALGKALEDAGDYPEAFARYAEGARLRREQAPYDAQAFTRQTRASAELFTKAFFAAREGWGEADPAPIFIVGLPRSGSTLIEQILASHSMVEGTMELPQISHIAAALAGPAGHPAGVEALAAADAARLGRRYIDDTQLYRKLGRPRFIDKMPNNFQYIGLIHLILPNAVIIDARRHPMGSCFSAFKQHFAQGQSFSYGLDDLGAYYRDYVALMDHFDAVLPGRVHRVIYEDLVEDAEGEIRRLLAHCGLPFEPGCLTFYETERSVRTVSSEQVRRPIFRDGLEQWRRFEPWLGPLKSALGPTLAHWRGGGKIT